jgi:hypothetical protein
MCRVHRLLDNALSGTWPGSLFRDVAGRKSPWGKRGVISLKAISGQSPDSRRSTRDTHVVASSAAFPSKLTPHHNQHRRRRRRSTDAMTGAHAVKFSARSQTPIRAKTQSVSGRAARVRSGSNVRLSPEADAAIWMESRRCGHIHPLRAFTN